jgi:polyketide synthase PksM
VSAITKVDASSLSEHIELKAIGLDSLMLMKVAKSVEDRFELRLAQYQLSGLVTVGNLIELVGAGLENYTGPNGSSHRELEVLQPHGDLPPSFWIHGGFGTTQYYMPLARKLAPRCPMYALRAKGLVDDALPLDDMRDLAAHYKAIIVDVCGNRPVQLAGYSQGGIIAYEIARQLQAEKRAVKSIVLLDSPFPDLPSILSVEEKYLLVFMNILYTQGLPVPPATFDLLLNRHDGNGMIEHLVDLSLTFPIGYREGELKEALLRYYRVSEANARAVLSYKIEKLSAPEHVRSLYFARKSPDSFFDASIFPFRGAEKTNEVFRANDCVAKWKAMMPSLEVHTTEAGHHFSLLDDQRSLDVIAAECCELYSAS